MHTLSRICDLDVSAASGLVALADRLYVVADDEVTLSVYGEAGQPLERLVLLTDALPEEPKARKAAKPDLEALALLPTGELLAMGSGSTARRRRGALVDPRRREVRAIDLAPLYEALERELPELNIEGAAVAGERLRLLQRGNGASHTSAVVDLGLAEVLAALAAGRPLGPGLVRAVAHVDLGTLAGLPLGFTDATPLDGEELLFAAAAEGGASTYEDGPCAGSVLGRLSLDGRVRALVPLEPPHKIEGIARRGAELLLVADPDDPTVRAPLFSIPWQELAARLSP